MRGVGATAVVASLLAACTVLTSETSEHLIADQRAAAGMHYALPMGVNELVLSVRPETAIFALTIEETKYIPDPEHRYFLRYRPLPNYEDKIIVEMNGKGKPFLKQVKADTTDKTGDIIVNLVKLATFGGKFESHVHNDAIILANLTVDFGRPEVVRQAVSSLNVAMAGFAEEQADNCRKDPPDPEKAPARATGCQIYAQLALRGREWRRRGHGARPLIELNVRAPQSMEVAQPADCTIGVCYRPVEPFLVTYALDGVVNSKTVLLPNASPLVGIDIRRAFFINKVQTIDFDENSGLLKSLYIDKKSELVAISKLPVDIIEAITAAFRLRVKVLDQQAATAEAESELIKAKANLAKAREAYDAELKARQARSVGTLTSAVNVTTRPPDQSTGVATVPVLPPPIPGSGAAPNPAGQMPDKIPGVR
jgi:hypothetical protein